MAGAAGTRGSTDAVLPSAAWIIELSSQVIFSMSAAVHFELVVGRDEKSVELGFAGLGSKAGSSPGHLGEHQHRGKLQANRGQLSQPKGVFSPAVRLGIEDTENLWNKPAFPTWEDSDLKDRDRRSGDQPKDSTEVAAPPANPSRSGPNGSSTSGRPKQKKVHLVVLTHGLHSNLGSDMLYLKESIDAAAKQAKEDARTRRSRRRGSKRNQSMMVVANQESGGHDHERERPAEISTPQTEANEGGDIPEDDESDEEEVIVRGFPGNACRTEKGIQYLGKRLAKWVLSMTYPDQEYLPRKKSVKTKISRVFTGDQQQGASNGKSQHHHSGVYHPTQKPEEKPYRITSISFIAHSLGGLTQTYAIAYIHKHSPHFFDEIRPINFVAMAAPFLGLSNENPLYVRFALDFGLVGRTGQDLGLAWRAPTVVRSGWGAMIGGAGAEGHKTQKQLDPGSKPLLRILPTGHTHQVLKRFRNRTVYSNVVNDGIVPLRTSCLLFLDWSGLGRVEKARRENGLIGTTLGWGWAELTGVNSSSRAQLRAERDSEAYSDISAEDHTNGGANLDPNAQVPQPPADAVTDDNTATNKKTTRSRSADSRAKSPSADDHDDKKRRSSVQHHFGSPINGLLSLLRPNSSKSSHPSPKQNRIYKRGQTTRTDSDENVDPLADVPSISRTPSPSRPGTVTGDEDPTNVYAPPKTSIFESAGDILNPPLPSKEFLIDPDHRPQTIFHDRVYHPQDIPPPPTKRPGRLSRSSSSDSRSGMTTANTSSENPKIQPEALGSMKVEEKIARAYHHGLSWRKVLVRLEPDAHNNMVVRRMFANAYGWPVVKHLVDTHFADTYEAKTADVFEPSTDKANVSAEEESTSDQTAPAVGVPKTEISRTDSEIREAYDSISDLRGARGSTSKTNSYSSLNKKPSLSREDSAQWDDALFDISDDSDEDGESSNRGSPSHVGSQSSASGKRKSHVTLSTDVLGHEDSPPGTSEAEIASFLTRSPVQDDTQTSLSPSMGPGGIAAGIGAGSTATLGLRQSSLDQQLAVGRTRPEQASSDPLVSVEPAATDQGKTTEGSEETSVVAG